MLVSDRFTRDLFFDVSKRYKDVNVKRLKIKELYEKFGVREVRLGQKFIGWMVGEKFVCVKKRYKSKDDVTLIRDLKDLRKSSKSPTRYEPTQIYHCEKCDGWHMTSKGHLAKSKNSSN